uniref:alpha-L-fucosidase n=1 Tax=Plectus sambesii TaxID=2011161 RepID=A0A914ULS4_9BILA
MFTAEFFDPDRFADIIKHSGAKYFVLTSKHHEGYTMYPSNYSWNWNSVDVGPHRDLVGDLKTAIIKAGGVHFGLYFSQFEWFNRLFQNDAKANFTTQSYVTDVSYPQMLEIVNSYQPEVIWSDGDWGGPDDYWKSKDFLAWLYNESPVKDSVVVNDRWGSGDLGKHGGFYTFADHFDPGHIVPHKWENCMTLDQGSWGFRRTMTAADVHPVSHLISQLARTISCGGNLLLNVGPTHDGRIVPIFEQRLRTLGRWLQTNGEAVYGTKPWIYQNDTNVWYTSTVRSSRGLNPARVFNPQDAQNTVVFAFVLDWPHDGVLVLPSIKANDKTRAQMLGHNHFLPIKPYQGGAKIALGAIDWHTLPSFDAWVIRLEFLNSEHRDPVEAAKNEGLLTSSGHPTHSLKHHARKVKHNKRVDKFNWDDLGFFF